MLLVKSWSGTVLEYDLSIALPLVVWLILSIVIMLICMFRLRWMNVTRFKRITFTVHFVNAFIMIYSVSQIYAYYRYDVDHFGVMTLSERQRKIDSLWLPCLQMAFVTNGAIGIMTLFILGDLVSNRRAP